MIKGFLKSTTVVAVGLSLAVPTAHPVMSQARDVMPQCVNVKGKPWAKLPKLKPEDVNVKPSKQFKAAQQRAQCVIEADGRDFLFEGIARDNGEVVLRRKDLVVAMIGLGLGNMPKAEVATPDPEVVTPDPEVATPDPEVVTPDPEVATPDPDVATPDSKLPFPDPDVAVKEPEAEKPDQAVKPSEPQPAPFGKLDPDVAPKTDPDQAENKAQNNAPQIEANKSGEAGKEVEVRQDDTQASTEAANSTVETQAARNAEVENSAAEVEVETVTDADTRASNEDFLTGLTEQNADKKDGLSNFEKFAIGAIGAVAVGAVLSNGRKVVSNSGDRVVVQREDGQYEVLKDDSVLLRQPGVEVKTERFKDGSSRETVLRPNGSKVVTIKTADGQVLRRVRVRPDGEEIVLFDDTAEIEPVQINELPEPRQQTVTSGNVSSEELRLALAAQENAAVGRRFSLQQIRQIRAVRELVPVIELEAVTFDTGSAAIRASEAEELRDLGVAMQRMIDRNPYEVFLVEGHTDAVGNATYNLALSDRRAESVALALTEYFDVPPENMVVQGYGEANLKVRTSVAERENRRATVRRITSLLQSAARQ